MGQDRGFALCLLTTPVGLLTTPVLNPGLFAAAGHGLIACMSAEVDVGPLKQRILELEAMLADMEGRVR
jgi:hypothetical protein